MKISRILKRSFERSNFLARSQIFPTNRIFRNHRHPGPPSILESATFPASYLDSPSTPVVAIPASIPCTLPEKFRATPLGDGAIPRPRGWTVTYRMAGSRTGMAQLFFYFSGTDPVETARAAGERTTGKSTRIPPPVTRLSRGHACHPPRPVFIRCHARADAYLRTVRWGGLPDRINPHPAFDARPTNDVVNVSRAATIPACYLSRLWGVNVFQRHVKRTVRFFRRGCITAFSARFSSLFHPQRGSSLPARFPWKFSLLSSTLNPRIFV